MTSIKLNKLDLFEKVDNIGIWITWTWTIWYVYFTIWIHWTQTIWNFFLFDKLELADAYLAVFWDLVFFWVDWDKVAKCSGLLL